MAEPYWTGDGITLWLGDCREVTEWLAADVLVSDPPYGIGWKRGTNAARGSRSHAGIQGDADTSVRDEALSLWGDRPGVIFGSFYARQPEALRQVLIYRKPADAGVVGSTTGWRRDAEPIFLTGPWPLRSIRWTSVISSGARQQGTATGVSGRYGHPHAKPVDVMETLIAACPLGVVADPFSGGGSTLIAARNQGRKAIGVELDERYCEQIAKRLAQADMFTEAS